MKRFLYGGIFSLSFIVYSSFLMASAQDEMALPSQEAEEQFVLGLHLAQEENPDYSKVKLALKKSIGLGVSPAMTVMVYHTLAHMNFYERGLPKRDYNQARLYFEKALKVKGSSPKSMALTQYFLGWMDIQGQGLESEKPNAERGIGYIATAYSSGKLPRELAEYSLRTLMHVYQKRSSSE